MKYVLSEDKAQEKGKRTVVHCYYYFIFAVRLSYMNNTCLAVVGVNNIAFWSLYLHKNELFLTVDIENYARVPPGVIS